MQNSGRMPSFITTRRCLIYAKLPTIKCLCVRVHMCPATCWVPGAAHCVALTRRAWAQLCGCAAGRRHRSSHCLAAQSKHFLMCLSCFWWQQLGQNQSQAEGVCTGSKAVRLQRVMHVYRSCHAPVPESQKHSVIRVTDGNTEQCLKALKHPLPTCQCAVLPIGRSNNKRDCECT